MTWSYTHSAQTFLYAGQYSWPMYAIWRAQPREWAHQHLSSLPSRCSVDALWHSARPIYQSAKSHNLLLPRAPSFCITYSSGSLNMRCRKEGERLWRMRSERLSRGPLVTAQQGIVDACWQVHNIAQRNGWYLWFTAGNKNKAALSRTSWVSDDGQAMLFVLNHRG